MTVPGFSRRPRGFASHCYTSLHIGGVLAVIFTVFFASPLVRAQRQDGAGTFSTSSSSWEGYSEFVRLAQRELGTRRIKPSALIRYDTLRPQDSLVIVRPLTTLDTSSLSAFLADGGRVALLDDFGEGASLLEKFGISRGPPPAEPKEMLRNNPALAIAVPSLQTVAGVERGRHPIVTEVNRIMTNHPTTLSHPSLTPVLKIPSKDGSAATLAVTGVIAKKGRLFVLGDPSIFINWMLRYPGNRKLAEGLLDYLANRSEGPGGPLIVEAPLRDQDTGIVWIVSNHFEQEGHYGENAPFSELIHKRITDLKSIASTMNEDGLSPLVARILAALLAYWAFSSQLRGNLRLGSRATASITPSSLLSPQSASLPDVMPQLSSQAGSKLALMELDGALRQTISQHLKLRPRGSKNEMSTSFKKAGLHSSDADSLASLLLELSSFAPRIGTGKVRRPSERQLKEVHRESVRLLSKI